jgi:hypothetical protein
MHAVAQRLSRAGVRMEEYPQSVPNLTEASQNLYELIQGRNLVVILTTRSGLQYPARWRRNPPADGALRRTSSRTRSTSWWRWRWQHYPR